jgi:threonine dehydrogenase-like Zn-dependent dehydrogenase
MKTRLAVGLLGLAAGIALAVACVQNAGTQDTPCEAQASLPHQKTAGKLEQVAAGQTHMHRYMNMKPLLEKIEAGEIDPSFIIHASSQARRAPAAYKTFRDKRGRLHQGGDDAVTQERQSQKSSDGKKLV